MRKLWRMLVWLRRIRHCRGFGVQSPWAYRMVCDVINGHEPHVGYDEMKAAYPDIDAEERKRCRLSLRLAVEIKPRCVMLYGSYGGYAKDYIRCGFSGAGFTDVPLRDTYRLDDSPDMVRIRPEGSFDDFFAAVARIARDGTAVMIDRIYQDARARGLWRDIVKGQEGVVPFDLYYGGLVFFDSKRYKQNYVINF